MTIHVVCYRDAVEGPSSTDVGAELLTDFQILGLDRGGVWGMGETKDTATSWIPALAFHPVSLSLRTQGPSEGGFEKR